MTVDAESYLATFEDLRRARRWGDSVELLRWAAFALGASGPTGAGAAIADAGDRLRRAARWFDPLRSPIRTVIAAILVRRGLAPEAVHDAVAAAREALREARVARGGTVGTLGALILVLQNGGRRPPAAWAGRAAEILRRWSKDHPWLTGRADVPLACLLAPLDEPADAIAARTERLYRALRAQGCKSGNALQFASQLLTLAAGEPDGVAARFSRIAKGLGERVLPIGRRHYDECALLVLSGAEPAAAVAGVASTFERLRQAPRRPSKDVAFALACGLALERSEGGRRGGAAPDLIAVSAAQAILAAQAAMVTAAAASASAAS